MRWAEVRGAHPARWLVIEALAAHTEGQRRVLDRIAVIEECSNGPTALRRYRDLHREEPARELYFVSTENAQLEVEERPWIGIRRSDAPHAP